MELKRLGPENREIIKALFADVFTREPWLDDWSDKRQLDAYIDDLIGQNNSLTLGYFEGDRLAALSMGHVKHWFRGTEYCVDELCVDRSRQRQGIGRAFLKEMEAFLLQNGIRQIFLQTDRSVPAYAFYQQNGFTELIGHVSFVKTFGKP